MKKLILMLLLVTGGVMNASADSKVIYLSTGDWSKDNAKFVVYMYNSNSDNAWADMYCDKENVYRAVIDTKYAYLVFLRRNDQTHKFEGLWNQSEDIKRGDENCYTFASWGDDNNGKKSTFTKSTITPKKIYVQKKAAGSNIKDGTPKFHDFTGTTGSFPGQEMLTESVDGQDWYVYETTKETTFGGLFCIEGNDDQTYDITFNLADANKFYFYYPLGSDARYAPVVRKEIKAANGYATFSSTETPNFGDLPTGVSAYTLSIENDTKIVKSSFSGTLATTQGVLLENTTGNDVIVNLPVWNNPEEVSDNVLVSIPSATKLNQVVDGKTNYILTKVGGVVGFFKVNTAGSYVNAGTAYISVSSNNARESYLFDDKETTSINAVENAKMEGQAYNLNGQRVAQPAKGLYIVNGKKVILK